MAPLPSGYAPMENVQSFTAPDGPSTGFVGGPVFINMLKNGAESGTDESDVAGDGLPDTGAGPSQPAVTGMFVLMLVTGVGPLGVAATSLRCTGKPKR